MTHIQRVVNIHDESEDLGPLQRIREEQVANQGFFETEDRRLGGVSRAWHLDPAEMVKKKIHRGFRNGFMRKHGLNAEQMEKAVEGATLLISTTEQQKSMYASTLASMNTEELKQEAMTVSDRLADSPTMGLLDMSDVNDIISDEEDPNPTIVTLIMDAIGIADEERMGIMHLEELSPENMKALVDAVSSRKVNFPSSVGIQNGYVVDVKKITGGNFIPGAWELIGEMNYPIIIDKNSPYFLENKPVENYQRAVQHVREHGEQGRRQTRQQYVDTEQQGHTYEIEKYRPVRSSPHALHGGGRRRRSSGKRKDKTQMGGSGPSAPSPGTRDADDDYKLKQIGVGLGVAALGAAALPLVATAAGASLVTAAAGTAAYGTHARYRGQRAVGDRGGQRMKMMGEDAHPPTGNDLWISDGPDLNQNTAAGRGEYHQRNLLSKLGGPVSHKDRIDGKPFTSPMTIKGEINRGVIVTVGKHNIVELTLTRSVEVEAFSGVEWHEGRGEMKGGSASYGVIAELPTNTTVRGYLALDRGREQSDVWDDARVYLFLWDLKYAIPRERQLPGYNDLISILKKDEKERPALRFKIKQAKWRHFAGESRFKVDKTQLREYMAEIKKGWDEGSAVSLTDRDPDQPPQKSDFLLPEQGERRVPPPERLLPPPHLTGRAARGAAYSAKVRAARRPASSGGGIRSSGKRKNKTRKRRKNPSKRKRKSSKRKKRTTRRK